MAYTLLIVPNLGDVETKKELNSAIRFFPAMLEEMVVQVADGSIGKEKLDNFLLYLLRYYILSQLNPVFKYDTNRK